MRPSPFLAKKCLKMKKILAGGGTCAGQTPLGFTTDIVLAFNVTLI